MIRVVAMAVDFSVVSIVAMFYYCWGIRKPGLLLSMLHNYNSIVYNNPSY